jgi:predicted nucleic acid-binding Zn ribbon protein
MRATAPNPTRRRRAAEVVTVTLPDVRPPAWHREKSPTRQCVICGEEFPARNFVKTCSPECSRNLWLANRRKYYAAEKILAQQRRRQRPNIRQCLICGKDFISRKNSKTCSPEHLNEHRRLHGHKYYLANREKWVVRGRERRAKRSHKIRQCVVCGKDFVVVSGKENTCSPEHRHERLRVMERARYRSEQRVLKTKYRRFP